MELLAAKLHAGKAETLNFHLHVDPQVPLQERHCFPVNSRPVPMPHLNTTQSKTVLRIASLPKFISILHRIE